MPNVGISVKDIHKWWKKLCEIVLVSPKFGPSSQGSNLPEEQNYAWFHVRIEASRILGRADIPCCKAWLTFEDGDLGKIPLRWQSDLPEGSSETTLIKGTPRLLPVVYRRDGQECATVTDEAWLLQMQLKRGVEGNYLSSRGLNEEFHTLIPGTHSARIEIQSGSRSWISPHTYTFFVPRKSESNSHFSLELDA